MRQAQKPQVTDSLQDRNLDIAKNIGQGQAEAIWPHRAVIPKGNAKDA